MKKALLIFFSCFLLLSSSSSLLAATPTISRESYVQKGNTYFKDGRHFMAINEYKKAIEKGVESPSVLRNLSILYYELGFLDEAVIHMERAAALLPGSDFLRMELGIIYLAKNKQKKAREQFMDVLERNPGFSDAYFYLGEIYFRAKQYNISWLFARMAQRLGHGGKELLSKLSKQQEPPGVEPWSYPAKDLFIRQIIVYTREKADEIIKRISEGELFEMVAGKENNGPDSDLGGFLGHFKSSEVHPKIAKALLERDVLSDPVVVKTDSGYHIVQRLVPFHFSHWEKLLTDSGATKAAMGQNKNAAVQDKAEIPEIKNNLNKAPEKTKNATFFVYVGAFKDEGNAQQKLRKLHELGYPGYHVKRRTSKSSYLHMVVAGKYDNLREAKKVGQSIAENGLTYFISSTK
jgi:tetratricopeptide (TPR) repeat protein